MKKNLNTEKKKYEKPQVIYERKIEAFAAVCTHNSPYKATPGAPSGAGICSRIYS